MTPLDKISSLFSSATEFQAFANTAHAIWGYPLLIVGILLFILYRLGYQKSRFFL